MATLIDTNGKQTEVFPADGENGFTLEEVYALIGCEMVEVACTFESGEMMLVDEEGWLIDEPTINPVASLIYGDYIAGNALVVSQKEFQ